MDDKEFLKLLGKEISDARKSKQMSQVDVCSIVNMDKPNLSAIENGRQNVTSLTLKKIADALDVKIEVFFKGIDRPRS